MQEGNSALHAAMMQSSTIARALTLRRPYVVAPVSAGISYLALSSTPSFPLVVALLTTLLVQADDIRIGRSSHSNALVIAGTTAVGGTLARLGASSSALSTPWGAIALSLLSMITMSSQAVAAAFFSTKLAARSGNLSGWTRLCVFPVVWTLLSWVESLTPLGRLVTWTPLEGYGMYSWLLPYFGAPILDWLAAGWAVVLTQAIVEDVDSYQDDANTTAAGDDEDRPRSRVPLLATLLLALAIPSHFQTAFHAVPEAADSFSVACILPPDSDESPLQRYVQETKQYIASARLVLWPEAAVTVYSETEKIELIDSVKEILREGGQRYTWVGVSYIEPAPEDRGKHRNVLTVINQDGEELFTYYKRNLVPLVESYSQVTENIPPKVVDFPLPFPISRKKNEFHEIPITASICLDFASPLPLARSQRKPALILAPSHTWHPDVGAAMADHARMRARELDTHVLWCDGGAGGRSALIGPHGQDILARVGKGSWKLDIPVAHPFNERRTVYSVVGSLAPLLFLCLVVPFALSPVAGGARPAWTSAVRLWAGARERTGALRERIRPGRVANERTPLLIDLLSDDPPHEHSPTIQELN